MDDLEIQSPEVVRAWQARTGLTNAGLAERIGRTRETIQKWRAEGVPAREARFVSLVMAAVDAGLGIPRPVSLVEHDQTTARAEEVRRAIRAAMALCRDVCGGAMTDQERPAALPYFLPVNSFETRQELFDAVMTRIEPKAHPLARDMIGAIRAVIHAVEAAECDIYGPMVQIDLAIAVSTLKRAHHLAMQGLPRLGWI